MSRAPWVSAAILLVGCVVSHPPPKQYDFGNFTALRPATSALAVKLVTLRLRDAVASANAGYTLTASNGSGGYSLQATLEEFTQVFTEPAKSHCIVQLRVSLWNSAGQITAQRIFRIEMPAQTPDASGAATCLAAAVNLDADKIVQWLSNEVTGTHANDATALVEMPGYRPG